MTEKGRKMSRIVVALGGNALEKPGDEATAENQRKAIHETVGYLADLAADGFELVLVHGNGPQVGRIVLQNSCSSALTPAMPLDVCDAMSQGMIGYWIQQCLQNELTKRGVGKTAVTLITQVEVDAFDPGFAVPSKPIGPYYSREEAAAQKAENGTLSFQEDAGRGWRRIVASPRPKHIVEIHAVRSAVESGLIPVTVGGGGLPVIRCQDGSLHGVSAVIDKDFSAELLAEELEADLLLILTAVEKVCLHFQTPRETSLNQLAADDAKKYIEAGEFAPGSMLPKIQAAVMFAESRPGRKAIITSLDKAKDALNGRTGTLVYSA